MMKDQRDPLLQALFAEARQDLRGEDLTARVMAKTRKLRTLWWAGGICAGLLILAGAWLIFAMPLLEFALLIAQGLGTTLVDLGEGWLALVFLPVNNIASLFVISVKAIRVYQKKMVGWSFSK